ncbi:Peroxidase 36 [Cardamine amara subsp. amara]|uniref:Peroxidase 36 n=1 Tax=Cardamine amara subsp. amara TaxID=228776 RepID=A0ABD0ZYL6_CARAN
MVRSFVGIVLAQISLFALFRLCMCYQTSESTSTASLSPQFYDNSCPKAQAIVQSIVAKAHSDEAMTLAWLPQCLGSISMTVSSMFDLT